ncbi:hypothetical protein [Nocardiopsis sp. NPDC006938]|uniref:hypothetical protein n=1 Tax=Nocardiopsis sp. NPDC006938 TaxID=3364337 RepID=UPI0036773925
MPSTPTAQPGLLSVPGPDADVPVLALDLGADNEHLQALGEDGLRLLRTTALDQLRTQGLQPVPPGAYVPGPGAGSTWNAELTPGRLVLRSPSHLAYDGTLAAWPAYTRAIEATGWLLLYVGHIQLAFGAEVMPAVRAAADADDVVAGIVPATVISQQAPGHAG